MCRCLRPKKTGAAGLIFLSIAVMLTGGGIGPPVIGILAGAGAFGIHSTHAWARIHYPVTMRGIAADAWPWVFGVSLVNVVYLVAGSLFIAGVFDADVGDITLYSFYLAALLIVLNIVTGVAYDMRNAPSEG